MCPKREAWTCVLSTNESNILNPASTSDEAIIWFDLPPPPPTARRVRKTLAASSAATTAPATNAVRWLRASLGHTQSAAARRRRSVRRSTPRLRRTPRRRRLSSASAPTSTAGVVRQTPLRWGQGRDRGGATTADKCAAYGRWTATTFGGEWWRQCTTSAAGGACVDRARAAVCFCGRAGRSRAAAYVVTGMLFLCCCVRFEGGEGCGRRGRR